MSGFMGAAISETKTKPRLRQYPVHLPKTCSKCELLWILQMFLPNFAISWHRLRT